MKLNLNNIKPKYIVAFNHLSLIILGMLFFNLQRNFVPFLYTIVLTTVLELLILTYQKKEISIDNILSAIITGAGILILLNTSIEILYLLAASISIACKHAFRNNKHNSPIMNPSLLGLIIAYTFCEFGYYKIQYDQFAHIHYSSIQITFLGLIVAYKINKMTQILTYFSILIMLSLLINTMHGDHLIYLLGPELSSTGLLFAFFMMTDPKTSPNSKIGQFLFSSALALITITINLFHIAHASFIALFFLNIIYYVYITYKKPIYNYSRNLSI